MWRAFRCLGPVQTLLRVQYTTVFFPGRERLRCENPQRPLGSYSFTSQSNWFACLKKYKPINARGSDPDPVVCMKVRFEAKVTRVFFSLSPSLSRLVVVASRLVLDLFREEKSRNTSGTRVLLRHFEP